MPVSQRKLFPKYPSLPSDPSGRLSFKLFSGGVRARERRRRRKQTLTAMVFRNGFKTQKCDCVAVQRGADLFSRKVDHKVGERGQRMYTQ